MSFPDVQRHDPEGQAADRTVFHLGFMHPSDVSLEKVFSVKAAWALGTLLGLDIFVESLDMFRDTLLKTRYKAALCASIWF